jgi:hypothetical protein
MMIQFMQAVTRRFEIDAMHARMRALLRHVHEGNMFWILRCLRWLVSFQSRCLLRSPMCYSRHAVLMMYLFTRNTSNQNLVLVQHTWNRKKWYWAVFTKSLCREEGARSQQSSGGGSRSVLQTTLGRRQERAHVPYRARDGELAGRHRRCGIWTAK